MKIKEIDREVTSRLPKDLNRMFVKKGINANAGEASADDNFVRAEIRVGTPNADRIIKALLILDKYTLYSASCCSQLDARGGIDPYALKRTDFAELRALRIAFEAVKAIREGTISALGEGDAFNVAFGSQDGTMRYYRPMIRYFNK